MFAQFLHNFLVKMCLLQDIHLVLPISSVAVMFSRNNSARTGQLIIICPENYLIWNTRIYFIKLQNSCEKLLRIISEPEGARKLLSHILYMATCCEYLLKLFLHLSTAAVSPSAKSCPQSVVFY